MTRPAAVRAFVVLTALAAIGIAVTDTSQNDEPSYRAGYVAASNPRFVRSALSDRGLSSTSFCAELLTREITGSQQTGIRGSEFRRGCEHAVHDAME
jgi:hypothetical protein